MKTVKQMKAYLLKIYGICWEYEEAIEKWSDFEIKEEYEKEMRLEELKTTS